MTKKQLTISIVAVVIVAAIVSGVIWLYQGSLNNTKKSVFNSLPLPGVLVGFDTVPVKTIINRLDTAEKILSTSGGELTEEIKTQILDQLVDAKLISHVANDKGIVVSQSQIDTEYQNILSQYGNKDEVAFAAELQEAYGMTIDEFKNTIIKEEVIKTDLATWFNKQENLNQSAYQKLSDLERMLNEGKSFEEVAAQYTQDEATKDFAGDSGFVTIEELLPEFQDSAKNAELNKPIRVASRYGVHLIIVSAKDIDPETQAERYNLKQIFFQPEDFQKWFKSETSDIKVTKLVNL